jgi:DNA end-binding protein Ku
LDFDLIDKRDMAPVGYRRINKRTGKEITEDNIVKGYRYEDDQYVIMSDEDFKQANAEATQTVDIVAFVREGQIEPYYYDTPYYLEPSKRAQKSYALLRETLRQTKKVAVGSVVLRTKQHLAALIPVDAMLLLITLRYAHEIRSTEDFYFPALGVKKVGLNEREIEMATRLVEDMTEEWDPRQYRDTYREDLLARVEAKAKAGKSTVVTQPEEGKEPRRSAEIIDLMSLLKSSLKGKEEGDTARKKKTTARSESSPRRNTREDTGSPRRRKRA